MSESGAGFLPWDGNEKQFEADLAFKKEQQRELEILDFFRHHRDDILKLLSKARSINDLLKLHDEFDGLMTEAETQVQDFRFFRPRMEGAMRGAQKHFFEKMNLVRDKINATEAARQRSADERRLQQQRSREHAERLRKTQQETNEILAQVRKSSREAADRHHETYMNAMFCNYQCPRCGNNKLLAHTYCHSCSLDHQRLRRW